MPNSIGKTMALAVVSIALYSFTGAGNAPGPVVLKGAELADGAKICVIGDGGTGGANQKLVAAALVKEGCARILYTGDVIYQRGISGPDDPQFKDKFHTPYKALLEGGVPFLMSLGNHDYHGNVAAWLTLAQRYPGKIIYPHHYYAEQSGDVCILALDTNIVTKKEQKSWVDDAMATLRDEGCELSLAFGHHPYWSSGEYGEARPAQRDFLVAHVLGKVDLYMAGHDHILSDELQQAGTRLFVSGAAGQNLYDITKPRPGGFAQSTMGYITVGINRKGGTPRADVRLVQVDAKTGATKEIHSASVEGKGIRD